MADMKMPIVGKKMKQDEMPIAGTKMKQIEMPNLLKNRQTEIEMPNLLKGTVTQKAPKPFATKETEDLSGEAWTRAMPSQTKVPDKGQQTAQSGRSAGKDVEKPTMAERVVSAVYGAAKGIASDLSSAMTTRYQGGQAERTARNQEQLAEYQRNLERAQRDLRAMQEENAKQPGTWTDDELRSQQYIVEDAQRKYDAMKKVLAENIQEKATEASHGVTGQLAEGSAADLEKAKAGLGTLGRGVVDFGVAGLQWGGDIAASKILGTGALIPMAERVFGGGAREARQDGATLGQQVAYGSAKALTSVATEQISNVVKPFAKAFGAGMTDDVLETAIAKAVDRFARTAAGKTALEAVLKTGAGFVSEGGEEAVEDLVDPLLKLIYQGDNAKSLAQNIAASYKQNLDPAEVVYDFLIGGALGGLGGAVEGVTGAKGKYKGYQTEVQNTAIDSAYDTMKENGMFSQEARKAARDAEDIMPKLTRHDEGKFSTVRPFNGLPQDQRGGVEQADAGRMELFGPKLTDEAGNWYDADGKKHSNLEKATNEMDIVPDETTGTGIHQPQSQTAQGQTSEVSSPFKTGSRESGVTGGDVPSGKGVPQGGMDVKNGGSTGTAAEITEKQSPQAPNKSVMPKTLSDLGIEPYGSEADYNGVENLTMQTSSLKTMRRRMQSEIQKIAATAKERSFARQVAAGQLDMEDVPGTVDRNTVEILSDYYRALNGRSETQPLQNRRNKILDAEMAKMEPLLGMDVAYDERGLERRMIPGEGRLSKAANAARDSFAKTFSTFRRNLQTPARICEFEWGREHGAKVYKTLFQPVVENNGRQVAWMNNMLDGVREFADSSGNKRKLTKKERAVVQQLVENGASENRVLQLKTDAENARAKAEKAKKAVERARSVGINDAEAIQHAAVLADEAKIAENLWSAAENIQKGWAAEDAAREFGIDKTDQSFKDLENYSIYLKAKQELDNSADVDSRIVDTAVKAYSENYRKLYDAINTFLVGHGYDTIGFIQGYAPHLQPETQKTAFQKAMKMLGLNETAMDLPTSISGQTADLKPYKQYDPFFQTRNGSTTDFDIVRGFESYIQYLGNIFYHTDDIMRIRTAEKYLRKTYTNKEASEMISWAENARNFSAGEKLDFLKEYAGVEEDSALSYQDASKLLEDYISKLYDQVGSISRYGELAKYLNNYANRLAGKQSELDRGVEYSLGRGALNWVNQMESKYGGAKIAFNVSSALNQTSQIPMVAVEAGEKNTFTAMMDFMNPTKRGKQERADFISQSNFLKGKAGVDWISEPETRSEKIREKGFAMSEAVDGFTSYVAVRGKYLQAVNEGKSPAEAMQIADEYGRRVMGSRAKGEKPMLFDTKNPFWQIATKFQLEVMNTWDHVFHDMPNDIKNTAQTEGKVSAARKLAGRIVKYETYAFLLNAGFRALYGGTPIPFDLLGNALEGIADAMGLTMGETVKTLLDDVLESVLDERVFGTDDDDKDDENDVGKGISSFLGNAANDMPLVGRAAALLGIGDQTLPMADFSKLGDLGTSIRKNGLISADTGEAALNVASEFAYGGNQLRKTGQGLLALGRGGSYSGDKLRYPVERTPENLVKGTLFGKSSFDSADEYYAHGSKTLTERMTRAYEGLVDNGVNREVAYDLIQQIRDQKDTPQKLEVITESLLTDREKLQLCYDVVAGKDDTWPDKLKKMMDAGLTWNEAEETYLEYLDLRDQEDMKAREKATRFAAWVDRSGVSDKQAAVIEDTLKFFTQIPAEADRYNKMTDAGLSTSKAEDMAMMFGDLQPEVGKDSVSNLQKYEAVVQNKALSEREQMKVLKGIMEDSEYEKLETAYAAGVSPTKFMEFKRATDGLSADKVFGKAISGSKKAKVLAAIDAMDISNIQKTALYYAAGYKESTLDDAPWISGKSVGRSREEALKLLQGSNTQTDDIMPKLTAGGSMPTAAGARNNTGRVDVTMPKLTDEKGDTWNPSSGGSGGLVMPRLSAGSEMPRASEASNNRQPVTDIMPRLVK